MLLLAAEVHCNAFINLSNNQNASVFVTPC